jgi:hypothetical protein
LTTPSGGPAPGGAGAPASDERRATAAGAVLVTVAVLIGLLLLAKGFSDDHGLASAAKATTTTTRPTSSSANTTSTTAVDPAAVHVLVANGSGVSGAASKTSQVLAGKQYPTPATGNASPTTTTAVYYLPGHQAEAKLVAQSLDLPAAVVQPMPNPKPVSDMQGSTVLVVIGSDGALNAVVNGNPTTTSSSSTTAKP